MVNQLDPLECGLAYMKNLKTATFGVRFRFGVHREVYLWVHKYVLNNSSRQFRILHQSIQLARRSSGWAEDYPLEAYCVVIRWMYTRDLNFTIDLGQFCMTEGPFPEGHTVLDGLMANPVRKAEQSDVVGLANLYQLTELQELLDSHSDN
ncbi:hypothetical protein BG005_011784 [Podila minutissima]|nr:hypothetical protein BG005_011784 [Podila minutissima]